VTIAAAVRRRRRTWSLISQRFRPWQIVNGDPVIATTWSRQMRQHRPGPTFFPVASGFEDKLNQDNVSAHGNQLTPTDTSCSTRT
jgi:hypothetical protein